jgi:acyl-CoA synthetase (AMP-forming)/AMP-acid ligase II
MMGMVTNKTHALGHLIENLSKDQPNKPALYFEDSSWTWGEFNSECNSYANFFQNLGMGY